MGWLVGWSAAAANERMAGRAPRDRREHTEIDRGMQHSVKIVPNDGVIGHHFVH